jgi:hypothetical protein
MPGKGGTGNIDLAGPFYLSTLFGRPSPGPLSGLTLKVMLLANYPQRVFNFVTTFFSYTYTKSCFY